MKCAVILLLAIFGIINSATVPSYIHICKRNDPDVSKCIRESVEFLRPKLMKGIPELGVPGLEPLRIKDIEVNRDFGNSHFSLKLKNVDVFGAGDWRATKLKLDIPNQTYRINLAFPSMRLVGDFDVDTKLLSFPLKGTGNFEANGTKCEATAILSAELKEVNGKRYMHFSKLDINLNIGDYSIKVENLFNGEQSLSQAVTELLNQNKEELLNIATPYIEAKASEVVLEIANKITENFEYDEVFPEK